MKLQEFEINNNLDMLKPGDNVSQGHKKTSYNYIHSIKKVYNPYHCKHDYKISIKSFNSHDLYDYEVYDLIRYPDYDFQNILAYGLGDSCMKDMYYFKLPKPCIRPLEVVRVKDSNHLNVGKNQREIVVDISGNSYFINHFIKEFYKYFNYTDETTDNYRFHLKVTGVEYIDNFNDIYDYQKYFIIRNDDHFKNTSEMIKEFKKEFNKFKKMYLKTV